MRTLFAYMLCAGLLLSCKPGAQDDTFILAKLAWVQDGRAEVEAYLRALQAERTYLTLSDPEEAAAAEGKRPGSNNLSDLLAKSSPERLHLSITGSQIFNQQDQSQQQSMVDWLALMIVDNLADPYAYEELVIDLQAEDGSSLLYQSQPLREILQREPRLRGE